MIGRALRQTRRMPDADEPLLTLEEAYRACYRFINQYYEREPIVPFLLMLGNMEPDGSGELRRTSDPATWHDWERSVREALASADLPNPRQPRSD
jgi:hypothetical protein